MARDDKKQLKAIGDQRIGGEPADGLEHFHVCGDCGQAFDLRSLVQLMHHDKTGHKPLTEEELRHASL